jgi:AcrR family transcriptional regulator
MTEITRKPDRRIERTRQLLSTALMDLIIERGYDTITIQDITDRANVSRATFYLHYKDKDELLFQGMEKIYNALVESHNGLMPIDVSEDDYETGFCNDSDFQHVAEYADFYRVMLSKKGSMEFVLNVMSYLTQVMTQGIHSKLGESEPKIPLDMIGAFLAGAQVGVTKWWLENDMQYSPQEVAKMHFFLALFGMRWGLGKDEKVEASEK